MTQTADTAWQIETMPQLLEARIKDDNWTGVSNAAERRRRQNRLHQRAWRRRKEAERQGANAETISVNSLAEQPSRNLSALSLAGTQHLETALCASIEATVRESIHGSLYLSHYWDVNSPGGPLDQKPFAFWEELKRHRATGQALPNSSALTLTTKAKTSTTTTVVIPPVIPYLSCIPRSSNTGDPLSHHLPKIHFPLSPDHQLLVLIQWNVFRAVLANMTALNLLHRLPLECGIVNPQSSSPPPSLLPPPPPPAPTTSTSSSSYPSTSTPSSSSSSSSSSSPPPPPPSLAPTPLQLAVPHPDALWIDLLPCPVMRDNALRSRGRGEIDDDELCDDLCGGLYDGFDDTATRGMIIWGEGGRWQPWEVGGWEVSEGFARKWGGRLLGGCEGLRRSTDKWRRGLGVL